MSDSALLQAVRDRLHTELGVDKAVCDITPGGQPPPHCGEYFIGIDDTGYQNTDRNPLSLDEVYGVLVVVTFKMAYAPKKSLAELFLGKGSIRDIARKVRVALHGRWEVVNEANAYIREEDGLAEGDPINGFTELLRFADATPIQTRSADWVWAADAGHPPSVYVRELRFTDARRVQTLESQE